MATRYTEGFRIDAVRIATTSGLTRPQIASDLGIGLSTLNKHCLTSAPLEQNWAFEQRRISGSS